MRGKERTVGSRIRIAFFDGQMSFTTGCKLGQGHYELYGDVLTVQRTLSTMVGCSEAREAQDAWLAGFVERATLTEPGSNQLRLSRGDVTVEFERQP